jgi:hypothetical protein
MLTRLRSFVVLLTKTSIWRGVYSIGVVILTGEKPKYWEKDYSLATV